MTDDTRKLIEEAEKARRRAAWFRTGEEPLWDRVIAVLRATLPTEDERALILAIMNDVGLPGDPYFEEITDAILAAGFRRSPVPPELPDPNSPGVHWECDCVPDLGPTHCHGCGEAAGRIVAWSETVHGLAAVPPATAPSRHQIAEQVRRHCTPSVEAYEAGGDRLIAAVADWIENPPEWVPPVTEEPEWEYAVAERDGRPRGQFGAPRDRASVEAWWAEQRDLQGRGCHLIRRRAAGPWVPVSEGGEG